MYDFQPTEQGELGFEKGDIIRVIESVYRDWWKGELRGKTGIFPVNYVEKIVDPSPSDLLKEASVENEVMNETRHIDRLLEMLSSTDPRTRDSFSDNDELQNLYNSTLSIRPKLVKLIEKYSLKKDELVALNEKFMQARTMYDGMLSNSIAKYSSAQQNGPYAYPPQQQHQSYSNGTYPYPSPAPVASPSYGQQPPAFTYQQQQQQQQQHSPAPQHQSTPQQSSFAYNESAPPQQQQQQQQQFDYNAPPQGQYQPPQQQQQHGDYNSQSPYGGAPPARNQMASPSLEHYSAPPQQQGAYSAYPPNGPPEGYPAGNYQSPGQQQAPYTPPGYNGQSQQTYAHNY